MENNQIQKSSPRDVFMYLLNVGALYASACSFLILLFQYVNVAFPDPLNPYYDPGNPIRWALASIIIIFPVFLWVSRFLQKDLTVNPEKGELKIRKWLVYFTIFAAAILIIGDLVTLIYNFLQGEITASFLLKILSVLLVAAAVFGYYLYDLRRKPEEFSQKTKIFVWAIIGLVLAAVVYGFFVAGSPFKARLVRFDRQKISDLQTIQSQIVNFWTQKERLPQSLDELKDPISGFISPRDPQSNGDYAYQTTGKLSFELCADFNQPSEKLELAQPKPVGAFGSAMESWNHGVGAVCFSRTIDPELYKNRQKLPYQ